MVEQLKDITEFIGYGYSRNSITFSVFSNIFKILRAIKENPNASYEDFKKMLKISGGALHIRLKDAQIMKLYTNGYGKHLTPLGERWLKESERNGLPTDETIKESCLNVSLFNFVYKQYPDLTVANKIFLLFKEYTRDNPIGDKYLAMSVRRYLEGIHNLKVEKRLKIRPRKPTFKTQNNHITVTPPPFENKDKFTMEEYILLDKSIEELINKFGLENFKKFVEKKYNNP